MIQALLTPDTQNHFFEEVFLEFEKVWLAAFFFAFFFFFNLFVPLLLFGCGTSVWLQEQMGNASLPTVPGLPRVTKENSCMISDTFSQHLKYKYAEKA